MMGSAHRLLLDKRAKLLCRVLNVPTRVSFDAMNPRSKPRVRSIFVSTGLNMEKAWLGDTDEASAPTDAPDKATIFKESFQCCSAVSTKSP